MKFYSEHPYLKIRPADSVIRSWEYGECPITLPRTRYARQLYQEEILDETKDNLDWWFYPNQETLEKGLREIDDTVRASFLNLQPGDVWYNVAVVPAEGISVPFSLDQLVVKESKSVINKRTRVNICYDTGHMYTHLVTFKMGGTAESVQGALKDPTLKDDNGKQLLDKDGKPYTICLGGFDPVYCREVVEKSFKENGEAILELLHEKYSMFESMF